MQKLPIIVFNVMNTHRTFVYLHHALSAVMSLFNLPAITLTAVTTLAPNAS